MRQVVRGQRRDGASGAGSDAAAATPIVLAAALLALFTNAIVYIVGIRSGSRAVRNAARRFHHAVGNPIQMRSAGTAGAYASVIQHRGRKTGRTYQTPVWAAETEDGFVIPIVYGARSDWLKNVLASGSAAIVHDGATYPVQHPEIIPMQDARAYFPVMTQLAHRLVHVDRCLRVRRVEVEVSTERLPLAYRLVAESDEAGAFVEEGKERTMKRQIDQVIPLPKSRRFMEEAIRSTHHKPLMHGLIEVDVTKARAYMRDVETRTGQTPSFTAFIIACLGRAVEENRYVHALRKGGRHLVLFRDVDVLTWIERELGGEPQVLPCIVRAANRRTFQEIHAVIRTAQVEDPRNINVGGAKAAQLLPTWAYRPYFALATRLGKWVPTEWKKRWGTITLTAVGMIGEGSGWGIPPSSPSICWITVGGIGQSDEEVDGRMRTRHYLNLTVSFDHNMIDAAPAARFTERLKGLIESGYSLPLDEKAEVQPLAT